MESKEQEGLRAPCTQWYIYMNVGRKPRAKGSIHLKTLRGDATCIKALLQPGWGLLIPPPHRLCHLLSTQHNTVPSRGLFSSGGRS